MISRNLQKLADTHPVLEKIRGRWQLTELGRKINVLSRLNHSQMKDLLKSSAAPNKKASAERFLKAPLLLINTQRVMQSMTRPRNNPDAENQIQAVLKLWRSSGRVVIHVRHQSSKVTSEFHPDAEGFQFLPSLEPLGDELSLTKTQASALSNSQLAEFLKKLEVESLVVAGFTANVCIDSTVRDALEMDLRVHVIEDGTALFDVQGPGGILFSAQRVHQLTMANLFGLGAEILKASDLLQR